MGGRGKKLTSEVYNPLTDTWTKVGNTEIPRSEAFAVRMLDGRVLITGGIGLRISGEIFDPDTGDWTRTLDMHDTRYRHQMIVLDSGKILVIGGNGKEGLLAETELFTP